MPVRVGVIGVGIMGAEHVRLLNDEISGSTVSAVFDVDAQRAEAVAAASGAELLPDPFALIASERVDCVLIASADATHEQFVLAAVQAQRPVLCEKPLAPDVEGCLRIVDAEAGAGRRLVSVGFMRRFDPGYTTIRTAYTAGQLGAALLVHCVHRNMSAGAPTPTALIAGSMVHELDIARWLLDDEIDQIAVHCPRASVHAGGAQDPVFGVLHMRSGVLVDVEVFVNAGYGYEVRCELVGENGTMLLDAPAPTVRSYAGAVGRSVPPDWRGRFADAYRIELQAWVDSLRTNTRSPLASAWDGYVATAAAAAGVEAMTSGRPQPVSVGERPALYR